VGSNGVLEQSGEKQFEERKKRVGVCLGVFVLQGS